MQLIPSTLFNRFLLIILLPMIMLQVAVTIVFYERHWDNVTQHMQHSLIGEISLILKTFESAFEGNVDIEELNLLNLNIKILNNQSLENYKNSIKINQDNDLKSFNKKLHKKLDVPTVTSYNEGSAIIVSAYQIRSDIIIISFSSKRIKSPTTYIFIIWMLAIATLLIIISIIFMRNQLRSIINLTKAADSFGKSREIINFKPTGATEIVSAGYAFINMKKRIERQIQYRTELLTHISHDLRTPLTRLKLQIELIRDSIPTEDMLDEINEMQIMICRYLDFAKEEGNEELQNVNVVEALKSMIKKFDDPRIKLSVYSNNLNILLRKQAFKRAINNLINNALKHCFEVIVVGAHTHDEEIIITIDDDGRGIDENLFEAVFIPFNKYDDLKDGYGLGLAIVKSIVQAHGGRISLNKSKHGGLNVKIVLPI